MLQPYMDDSMGFATVEDVQALAEEAADAVLSALPAPEVTITDEMVERAAIAHRRAVGDTRAAMKVALNAALQPGEASR